MANRHCHISLILLSLLILSNFFVLIVVVAFMSTENLRVVIDEKTTAQLALKIDSKGGAEVAQAIVKFAIDCSSGIPNHITAAKRQRESLKRPPKTVDEYLAISWSGWGCRKWWRSSRRFPGFSDRLPARRGDRRAFPQAEEVPHFPR